MASALDPRFKGLKYVPRGERGKRCGQALRHCGKKNPAELLLRGASKEEEGPPADGFRLRFR